MLHDGFTDIAYADAMAERARWAGEQCVRMMNEAALLPAPSNKMAIAGLEATRRDYEEETHFWSLRWYALDFLRRAS